MKQENNTVVSTDVEQIEKLAEMASEYSTIYDAAKDKISNACSVAAEEGYIAGYNAAIQSQQKIEMSNKQFEILMNDVYDSHLNHMLSAADRPNYSKYNEEWLEYGRKNFQKLLQENGISISFNGIQSQSVQPTDAIAFSSWIVGCKEGASEFNKRSKLPLDIAMNELYTIWKGLPTPVQPTGSVRERIERYQRQMDAHDENFVTSNDVQDMKESYYYKGRRDEAYDSAAANLPVGNGWTDVQVIDMIIASKMEYHDLAKEGWEQEIIDEYKLTHSPVDNKDK